MNIDPKNIGMDVGVLILTFLISVILGPKVIDQLRILKFGQNINTDAPVEHQKKQGTPTMGGVLMIISVTLALLFWYFAARPHESIAPIIAVYLIFVSHAALGFTDDYLSAKRGKNLGLRAREKVAGQFVLAALFIFWLAATAQSGVTTVIQYWPGHLVDLGYGYYVLVFLWIAGLSNAANLADGLDGLAGGLATLTALGLAWTVSTYGTEHLPTEHLPIIGYAIAGSCLGFLWFNAHPAKVFMGDTGSLALGAAFAAMAIVGKQEILVLVIMAVFLMEMFSVMIQVAVFKATGGKPNGRRVFRMTPIHHHFELIGWKETLVVARFWMMGVIALAIALVLATYLSPWISHP